MVIETVSASLALDGSCLRATTVSDGVYEKCYADTASALEEARTLDWTNEVVHVGLSGEREATLHLVSERAIYLIEVKSKGFQRKD